MIWSGTPMHGLMFAFLRRHVNERLGADAWLRLLDVSGIGPRLYLPVRSYLDDEFTKMLAVAAESLGLDAAAMQDELGRRLVPHLVEVARPSLRPEWRTLEILGAAPEAIRRMRVSAEGSAAITLPFLVERPDGAGGGAAAGSRTIVYTSPRRLCALARGIVAGLGEHFGQAVQIRESACMHQGAPACRIEVTVA